MFTLDFSVWVIGVACCFDYIDLPFGVAWVIMLWGKRVFCGWYFGCCLLGLRYWTVLVVVLVISCFNCF